MMDEKPISIPFNLLTSQQKIMRLRKLRDHISGLDSASDDALLLSWAIIEAEKFQILRAAHGALHA